MAKNSKRGEISRFAEKAQLSSSYAHEVFTGKKVPPLEKAAWIFHRTGRKFGALAHANNRDACAVVRVLEAAGQLAA